MQSAEEQNSKLDIKQNLQTKPYCIHPGAWFQFENCWKNDCLHNVYPFADKGESDWSI